MLRLCSSPVTISSRSSSAVSSNLVMLLASGAFNNTFRGIRSVIPPRPAVTTLLYLDNYGRPVRSRTQETPLSFIRTRDNLFYLQRVLPGGEVVRWRAPGLDRLKHATNFENYSLNDIDEHGGILVPADVVPTQQNETPPYLDVVRLIMNLEAEEKITRKTRRHWHRRLHSHWKESPEKYSHGVVQFYVVPALVLFWLAKRFYYSVVNEKPFWDIDVYNPKNHIRVDYTAERLKRFSDMHPEQEGHDIRASYTISPAQIQLSRARAELRESDVTDPHFHSQLWWKIRHCRHYGHWPKDLTTE